MNSTPSPATHDATAPFDPDDFGEQSEQALDALIKRLETQALALRLGGFDQSDALALGLLLVDLATTRALPVAIDIRREQHILFHASLPGATPDNDVWIERKSRTAQRYLEPSLLVGLKGRRGGRRLEDNGWFDERLYASHGGAVPIHVDGTGVVAIATVSGLPQQEDHELVVEALQTFLAQDRPKNS